MQNLYFYKSQTVKYTKCPVSVRIGIGIGYTPTIYKRRKSQTIIVFALSSLRYDYRNTYMIYNLTCFFTIGLFRDPKKTTAMFNNNFLAITEYCTKWSALAVLPNCKNYLIDAQLDSINHTKELSTWTAIVLLIASKMFLLTANHSRAYSTS